MVQLTGFTGENQELEECEIRNLIGVDSFVVSGDGKHWNITQGWVYEILRKTLSQPILEVFKGLTDYQVLPGNYDIQLFQVFIYWNTEISSQDWIKKVKRKILNRTNVLSLSLSVR